MKRIICLLLAISICLVLCYSMVSCVDKENVKAELIGKWYYAGKGVTDNNYTEELVIFYSNGTAEYAEDYYYVSDSGKKSHWDFMSYYIDGTYEITEDYIIVSGPGKYLNGEEFETSRRKFPYTYNSDSGKITKLGGNFNFKKISN